MVPPSPNIEARHPPDVNYICGTTGYLILGVGFNTNMGEFVAVVAAAIAYHFGARVPDDEGCGRHSWRCLVWARLFGYSHYSYNWHCDFPLKWLCGGYFKYP